MLRRLDDRTSVSGQIRPEDVAGLAEAGVTMLINNRPDGEEPDQPPGADVEAMQDALEAAGGGRTLAYCRSGNRSALAWALAMRAQGRSREEVEQQVAAAGFNVAPIAHLL